MALSKIILAIDVMGGDFGLSVTIPGVLLALQDHLADPLVDHPEVHMVLVGDQSLISQALLKAGALEHPRIKIQHASQHVAMDESPTQALRTKKDSSMRIAINLVESGKAQACVSAGNTGAMMATAKFVLKMIPGINRPAILALIPTQTKHSTYVLDLGANVDCKPEHLLQFAIMGSLAASACKQIKTPTIGLLNIGHEAIKGNDFVKQTDTLLRNCSALNYFGFIEANDITSGKVDVVVCDGFTGNVALKAMEGSARLVTTYLKEALMRNWLTKCAAWCISPVLKDFKNKVDPSYYNGASLIGLRGIVMKSHGGANAKAFSYAIKHAVREAYSNIPALISQEIKSFLNTQSPSL